VTSLGINRYHNVKNINIIFKYRKMIFYIIYSWERWQSKLMNKKILNNKTMFKIQLGGPVVIIVTNYRRLWRRSIVIRLNFGLPKIVYCWLVHEGGPIRPLTNLDFSVLTILYYIFVWQISVQDQNDFFVVNQLNNL